MAAESAQNIRDRSFRYACGIGKLALREARESVYWLRICLSLALEPKAEIEVLRNEGEQIGRILGSIVIKAKSGGA